MAYLFLVTLCVCQESTFFTSVYSNLVDWFEVSQLSLVYSSNSDGRVVEFDDEYILYKPVLS